ncbi:pullulanase [Mesobacillus boroniphilus JCM 21738]|uniref:Pullulanase n=1 Tax=Mesobacillus boroniphilus JCM 21738 TaxID=1294265 RepID=W4RPD9_9BACI|nr:pullulanase [Mesobacillus boroniphilus JCM 21738]
MDWDLRDANMDNVQYIKGIIEIRKTNEAFRLPDSEQIRKNMEFFTLPAPLIGFSLKEIKQSGHWEKILVLINPSMDQQLVELTEDARWSVLADHEKASAKPYRHIEGDKVLLEPCSLFVLAK